MTDKDIETINVGIVGHIDHGKTTLLQRLSGKWTDTHSEELKRGITIKLGYSDCVLFEDKGSINIEGKGIAKRHVSFIDAPGHEMLMATMLSGSALIDAAILVVAANEGIKPQTREHLMALQAKGITNLVVVQNKIDLVDKEGAEKNYKEIREFLAGRFDNAPVVPVSAQQGVNIEEVWKLLLQFPIEKRNVEGDPVFLVARSFDINKPGTVPEKLSGTVLGGTLKQGKLKEGDEIEIKPGLLVKEANQYRYETLKCKINGLFKGSKRVKELGPGGSMSIETGLDMSLGKGDVLGGNVVGASGKLPELSQSVSVSYKLFDKVYGNNGNEAVSDIRAGETVMVSLGTAIRGGTVKKSAGSVAEIELKAPVVAFKGDNVGLARNFGGHWRLVGYGKVE
tara:strand:- start:7961 stop:9148 length:1188 start_codon:yes stop_codon:yes gene_type:complete